MSFPPGTRVLHVIEPWAGPAKSWLAGGTGSDALTVACGLVCASDPASRVLLLGPTRAESRAAAIGVMTTDSVCPPAARPELARAAARRFIRSSGPFDAAVCWGRRAGRLARAIARDIPAVSVATLGTAHSGRSNQPDLPGFGSPRSTDLGDDRRLWRQEHRLGEYDVLIALLDEPSHAPNARRFMFILGTLEVAGRVAVGMLPTGTFESARARRFRRAVGLRTRVIIADRPVPSLLSVCDIGVLLGPFDDSPRPEGSSAGVARFNAMLAMSAGLPVVTAEVPGITDGLPEPARAHLTRSHHSTDIGRSLFELVENPTRRAHVRAALLDHSRRTGLAWVNQLRLEPLPMAGPRSEPR
ncbi:MAG: hypothetical protein IT436_05495 [Phycisphaerales bacterium]|nr:hypothetical protein [Phycisphaerales bacterium]